MVVKQNSRNVQLDFERMLVIIIIICQIIILSFMNLRFFGHHSKYGSFSVYCSMGDYSGFFIPPKKNLVYSLCKGYPYSIHNNSSNVQEFTYIIVSGG